jgi:hypothetical protein
MAVSSRATRRPDIEVSAIAPRRSLVTSFDDVQDAEAAPIGELVMDRATRCATGSSLVARVDRPARIWPGLHKDGRACADCLAPRPPLAHSQALLAVQSVDAVDARGLTLAPQQDEQQPIAEPASLVCKFPQAHAARYRRVDRTCSERTCDPRRLLRRPDVPKGPSRPADARQLRA